jgi:hypothetical protein
MCIGFADMKELSYALKFAWGAIYCAGDKIEKNEMGWACGAYG